MLDYIVVGLGLAGIAISEELRERERSFVVFEDGSQTSSLVAGGMYNPVVLKRFNAVWNATEQLDFARPFYRRLERRLQSEYDQEFDILRVFKSVEEQNNWLTACDRPVLRDHMLPEVESNLNPVIKADHGMGRVTGTGRVAVGKLVSDYRHLLADEGRLKNQSFDHNRLEVGRNSLTYEGLEAHAVIFCEGNGVANNPYFNYLPLQGTKGELLTIHAPELILTEVVKSAVFVMPLGDDLYKVGATFNWKDKTNDPTPSGRADLEKKLRQVIGCDFEVKGHEAGVRPTTQDRRPFLGSHPEFKNLAVLNGLGTRGVMVAPLMARKLIDFLENLQELPLEATIDRYASLWSGSPSDNGRTN